MRQLKLLLRCDYGMNTLASYVLFTGGILWYIVKYNFQYNTQSNRHIQKSTLSKLNYWVFWIVSVLFYTCAAVVAIFDDNNIEGITESVLIIITIGVILDTYGVVTADKNENIQLDTHSVLPGKGYTAIIVSFTFFTFDPVRRNDETYFMTILALWIICLLVFLVGSISHFNFNFTRSISSYKLQTDELANFLT